ncbi:MAG TPA: KorB domain-containing protein [Candidatus Acidoferrum sp.]|jgi:predicted transcriptional regulator|nr:KorB domain-containing protein [Candidatus Acidoferrum sp.]
MREEIELAELDVRYENYRMKNPAFEKRLLASIAQRGIEQALEGAAAGEGKILLNGFKRRRCALHLGIRRVPYVSLGEDQAGAILNLLRLSNQSALSLLEQARFIDQLRQLKMSVADIAEQLSRSKSWVSMRLGLLEEISPRVQEEILAGRFPVYPYMYILRPFMRLNRASQQEVEEFVLAVSGQRLSVREIEQLAYGYFRGPRSLREMIQNGHAGEVLAWMRQVPQDAEGCSEWERILLRDLELVQKYMQRVMGKSLSPKLQSPAFFAQAHLVTAGLLSRHQAFFHSVRGLHDRSGQAQSGVSAPPGWHEPRGDYSPSPPQP